MKRTTTKVQAYLTQVEKKNNCLNRLNTLRQSIGANAVEYEKCVFEYFGLLMDDISKNKTLSKAEREFVKNNVHLLDKYPVAKRQELKTKLEKAGYVSTKTPKTKTVKVTKTYDELFPETDMSRTIERTVKQLKDAYVYLKPAIKLCDKLIDYIHTLKFTVTTTVSAPAEKKVAPKSKEVTMSM